MVLDMATARPKKDVPVHVNLSLLVQRSNGKEIAQVEEPNVFSATFFERDSLRRQLMIGISSTRASKTILFTRVQYGTGDFAEPQGAVLFLMVPSAG
jgi:hypothetical protein